MKYNIKKVTRKTFIFSTYYQILILQKDYIGKIASINGFRKYKLLFLLQTIHLHDKIQNNKYIKKYIVYTYIIRWKTENIIQLYKLQYCSITTCLSNIWQKVGIFNLYTTIKIIINNMKHNDLIQSILKFNVIFI